MKTGGKSEGKSIPKINIITGLDPEEEERTRKADIERIEQERGSKLN